MTFYKFFLIKEFRFLTFIRLQPVRAFASGFLFLAVSVVFFSVCYVGASDCDTEKPVANNGNEICFEFFLPEAYEVRLAGSFTEWEKGAIPMMKSEDGVWRLKIVLQPGRYPYKYIIDGSRWQEDPGAFEYETDPYGGRNSVVYVGINPAARDWKTFPSVIESSVPERLYVTTAPEKQILPFFELLRRAGLLYISDSSPQGYAWAGGNSTFILLGPLCGAGEFTKRLFDFLSWLQFEAAAVGGRVIVIPAIKDFIYLERPETIPQDVSRGFLIAGLDAAREFSIRSKTGRWLRSLPVAVSFGVIEVTPFFEHREISLEKLALEYEMAINNECYTGLLCFLETVTGEKTFEDGTDEILYEKNGILRIGRARGEIIFFKKTCGCSGDCYFKKDCLTGDSLPVKLEKRIRLE